jgi:kynurenine formamidase
MLGHDDDHDNGGCENTVYAGEIRGHRATGVMITATKRWKRRPENSSWGDFGPDDQLGRVNFITPAKVHEAIGEVKDGKSICLSLPLNLPGDQVSAGRAPPKLFATGENHRPNMNRPMESEKWPNITDILCDDAVTLALQYSTQWDSLCHHGYEFDADGDGVNEVVYYNGWRPEDIFGPGGVKRLGIETFAEACLQTRGIMIDLRRHFGPGRRAVSLADMRHVLKEDRIEVRRGDILVLHTGYAQTLVEMDGHPDRAKLRHLGAELDGLDQGLLQWITDSEIAGIAADTAAVETFRKPTGEGPRRALMPLHEHCLFKLGIPLGEYWYLTPLAEALAKAGRTAFLLTAPPLRLPGAVGSPVTPVGTI